MQNQEKLSPWEKSIRNRLAPHEDFDSAINHYTNINPDIQEILDSERLIEIGSENNSDTEIEIGTYRLRNVVLKILDNSKPEEHPGFDHAMANLTHVMVFFPDDPEVQEIIRVHRKE